MFVFRKFRKFVNFSENQITGVRVWIPPPYPTGAPWGPHPHPPWGWGIDFEKPRGWGILAQTPWSFGGVFDAFLCFSDRKNFVFLLVFEKKARFFFY